MSDETMEEAQAEHQYILDDIDKAAKRAEKAKFLEAAKEFADNCYPLMQAGFEHFGERLSRLEGAMDALIDGSDSILQPELAGQILATLEVAKKLATMTLELRTGTLGEEAVKSLHEHATAFLGACDLTVEAIEEHTGAEDDEGEESEDE